jgi:hypothetical protein
MTGIDITNLDYDALCDLRDAVTQRILELKHSPQLRLEDSLRLFEETKLALSERGVTWHSLERWQWMDGEVRFWVNPTDQVRYATGWFPLNDIIAWLTNQGPIVRGHMPTHGGDIPIQWIAVDGDRD